MLLPQKVKVKWCYQVREWYESLGYEYMKPSREFEVDISELSHGSQVYVRLQCDYCGREFQRKYKDHNKIKKNVVIKKDACNECRIIKQEECNIVNYGIKNASQTEEAKQKRINTCLEKYGSTNVLGNKEIREKAKDTVREKYGVENVFQHEEIKEKLKQTLIKKYGETSVSRVPEIKKRADLKRAQTMYENGTVPCSTQQKYIHSITGGKLNYPVLSIHLDIAFPEEKVYIEYQGSGHDMDVKIGKLTKEEFKNKEINRYYFLKNKGWKMIEFISKTQNDFLPSKNKIIEIVNYAKEYLNTGHSWIAFDFDKGIVRTSQFENTYDFGKLVNGRNLNKLA